MSYLDELQAELTARGDKPVTGKDLLRALRPVAQALEESARNRGKITETVGFVNDLQARLFIVDALPADAPYGALIRLRAGTVAQRATLFLGNGPGQPLSKLVPVAV